MEMTTKIRWGFWLKFKMEIIEIILENINSKKEVVVICVYVFPHTHKNICVCLFFERTYVYVCIPNMHCMQNKFSH